MFPSTFCLLYFKIIPVLHVSMLIKSLNLSVGGAKRDVTKSGMWVSGALSVSTAAVGVLGDSLFFQHPDGS